MKTRTSRFLGVTAAVAALTASLPLAVSAYADPPPLPPPTNKTVDPQGPGCDKVKAGMPDLKTLVNKPVSQALAAIPAISTFNSAVSGGLNPAVNITSVLDNGPYVVFAPTNEAFAALDPAKLEALKADPAALTSLDYYHVFLGVLGNDTVKGQRPTQQGTQIKVTGDGGDIKVNDTAKLVCGAIEASNARIYVIDTVLDLAEAPAPVTAAGSETSTSTSATTATSTSAAPSTTESAPASTSSAPATTTAAR
ncbi:fasciclin [Mycolicibacterium mucogenicum]|uniref:Fasciclin n=2 Tax=Mycolicibacterium mucogenicum TaxID=56689 RepID=A0A8H2PFN0_MYCMU|nr:MULTISPECIES: fasciclin domain-containing protein [Mycobacteriaceae]KAB7761644.1 fasciclin [Mycolicibacterium mucogenicum DSM 44124]OBJ35560.1 fasciclin [Mycolicibacterium mucogenicum]QPG70470.1 fasciclin domain-containing protein [Mycolicibacterium mucogenicum DSM 44124]RUP31233.1 MAG: fasciclin domain-containing protein [Mycolicibacterium sp.]SEA95044.1 Uncaracterized surface protein containing fasciclin (FAS1) repeats [Mycobacterium sp. 283mftsu]